jgi:hypothetical protein
MLPSCSRRSFVVGSLAGTAGVLLPARGEASVFRALPLSALVRASDLQALVLPLAAESKTVTLGGSRRIVTDTRVRVERTLGAGGVSEAELLIRTLGGVAGERGELVDGEARLAIGERAVLFLRPAAESTQVVVGMAQGHYPVRADEAGVERLFRSPGLPRLLRSSERPAVEELPGMRLEDARRSILGVR